MPNTLAHVGLQGLANQGIVRDIDPQWIYLGCLVPDLPWILQRIVVEVAPTVDRVSLRYYVDIQASLAFSILACLGFALLARNAKNVFLALSGNAFLHLMLDALQTKWGNGVHFFAPLSWEMTSFDMFWPESLLNYALTAAGLIYIVAKLRSGLRSNVSGRLSARRLLALLCVSILYFTAPLFLLDGPREADNHYLQTRTSGHDRVGLYVEFDRATFTPSETGGHVQFITKEPVHIPNLGVERASTVSVKGFYTATDTLMAADVHVHSEWFRDLASAVGIVLIALSWVVGMVRTEEVLKGPGFAGDYKRGNLEPCTYKQSTPPRSATEPFGNIPLAEYVEV